jgi:hypothetical protein
MSSSSSSSPPEWDQLLIASQKNLPDTIRTLVAEGVDPSHANRVEQSALHIAAIWAHGAFCEMGEGRVRHYIISLEQAEQCHHHSCVVLCCVV